ncbi:hypothetical protein LINGRAHAP2_LOCUS9328, partial [Linum grandiflorum]
MHCTHFHLCENRDSTICKQLFSLLQEHRIEGYTPADQASIVVGLLLPGTIYEFDGPFLIYARQSHRSCPDDYSISIMPMNLLAPIYEDPIRPFFPRDAYNVVPAASLRPLHVSPTMCSDIIGRLVSITDPILSVEEGSLSFTVVLDDP